MEAGVAHGIEEADKYRRKGAEDGLVFAAVVMEHDLGQAAPRYPLFSMGLDRGDRLGIQGVFPPVPEQPLTEPGIDHRGSVERQLFQAYGAGQAIGEDQIRLMAGGTGDFAVQGKAVVKKQLSAKPAALFFHGGGCRFFRQKEGSSRWRMPRRFRYRFLDKRYVLVYKDVFA